MTVASVRDVRDGRAPWWDADQIGKPITTTQAHWLRRARRIGCAAIPMNVTRGLARRGLIAGIYYGHPGVGLTERGTRIATALGELPEQYHARQYLRPDARAWGYRPGDSLICPGCGKRVNVELVAWGATAEVDVCINCWAKVMP